MWRSGPAPPGLCGGAGPAHRGSDGGSAGLPGPAHRGSTSGSAGLSGPAHRGSDGGSAGLLGPASPEFRRRFRGAAGLRPPGLRRRFYRGLGQSVTARPVRADSVAASARRSASMASAIEVGGVLPSATASMKAVSSRR